MPRRLQHARASDGLARWEARAERPLLVLALAFLVVVIVPAVADIPRWAEVVLQVANVAIWAVFVIDYGARLYLAPERWRFVRRHPLDLLLVLVPFLRPLRAARLLRLLRVSVVAGALHGRARRSLHATVATYVGASAGVMLLLSALAMYDTERTAKGGNIRTFGDALWWAATTVTTVGYGDRYPTTGGGRLIAATLMLFGIALLGVISATIAAWFVSRLRVVEESEERTEATLADVLDELRALRARLDERVPD
ncbi:MAG: ion transporter [Frankiales bacterium]|nr:ion transporter [Frankiales bacterium]